VFPWQLKYEIDESAIAHYEKESESCRTWVSTGPNVPFVKGM
jgi:hypothetical protein